MPLQVDSSTFAATIQFAEKVKLWSGNCTSPSSMVTSACLIFGKGRKGTKFQLCDAAAADDAFAPRLTFTSSRAFLNLVENDAPPGQTPIERTKDVSK